MYKYNGIDCKIFYFRGKKKIIFVALSPNKLLLWHLGQSSDQLDTIHNEVQIVSADSENQIFLMIFC
jgi:hypothetical protein